ncbi:hypothetical protein [Paraburkholderia phosphatilytica]|uniref:hypothetical protein n=1 Tax=Paraburkholderia phosphatilytica TaxID=2282883 RepID=UPI001F0C735C|nr:hypothetical protein [Paraburkholderia phosphatilytica]
MKRLWRGLWAGMGVAGAVLVAGCVGQPTSLSGGLGAPSFAQLQQMCDGTAKNYGEDSRAVYSTLLDAYVAQRHHRLSKEEYCAFQTSIAQQYTALGASGDPKARSEWASFFNDQRAKAISWRADVDPMLRGG